VTPDRDADRVGGKTSGLFGFVGFGMIVYMTRNLWLVGFGLVGAVVQGWCMGVVGMDGLERVLADCSALRASGSVGGLYGEGREDK
jgi:hypothetical protein